MGITKFWYWSNIDGYLYSSGRLSPFINSAFVKVKQCARIAPTIYLNPHLQTVNNNQFQDLAWFWYNRLRATSHKRLSARDHCTSSTLIGEKTEPDQVRFTLSLRHQWNMWMQDRCKKCTWIPTWHQMGSCLMITWNIFQTHFSEVGRPNTKLGDHGTPNARSQPLVYSTSSCVRRTRMNRNPWK